MNGDGRVEVITKIGPDEDMRDAEGKVERGGVDGGGLTAHRARTRAPWPPRDLSRVTTTPRATRSPWLPWMDGRPLLALRGTYNLMLADAWQFKDGQLQRLWSYTNEDLPGRYQGQGAHNCLCADVDGDGRDEVILGS